MHRERVALAIVIACAGTGDARAEIRHGVFAEMNVWVGPMWTTYKDIPPRTIDPNLVNIQWAGGLAVDVTRDVQLRLGPVLDAFTSETQGAAFGISVAAAYQIARGWWLGPRVSGSLGWGSPAPETGDGLVLVGGLRVRNDYLDLGVDVISVSNSHASGFGVVFGGGVDGRIGKYGVIVSAGVAALLGLVVLAFAPERS